MNDAATEAKLAYARTRYVMIATPIARECCYQYTLSLVETVTMLTQMGIRHRVAFVVGNSNIARARNELVAEFLISEATDLLFIDSDMGWRGRDVVRLIGSPLDVIGGVGRQKVDKPNSDPRVWCCKWLPDLNQHESGGVEVESVGTGFLKITRTVFDILARAHPEWKRVANRDIGELQRQNYYRFFRMAADENETGEDYAFCQAWRARGGRVWIEPDIELVHVGQREFRGRVSEHLLTAAEETQ